uniref:CTP synthase n=1 Tax=Lygus hesperus TaxID=30085 RepID=A0A0A9XIB6_LYGHE
MPENLLVRCLVCSDLLSYDRESTEPLIAHLQEKHPYIHVSKVPISASADELINPDINIERTRLAQKSNKELKNQFPGRKILRRQSSCPISGKISPGKLFCPAC